MESPYRTRLDPSEEIQYQAWRQVNQVPDENTGYSAVYDMPGYYKDNQSNISQRLGDLLGNLNPLTEMKSDGLHYPDTYKTPFHPSYSNESKYKFKGINREWQQNQTGGWDLLDLNTKNIIKTDNG